LGFLSSHLRGELDKLALQGYALTAEPIEREGLRAINFQVHEDGVDHHDHHHHPHNHHNHTHPHEHAQAGDSPAPHSHHRDYREIRALIQRSGLSTGVKERALAILRRLAEAEADVHGTAVEDVHFHEVGAVDSIVDIVGACIGFEYLGVDEFYSSALNLGSGTVTFSHGTWPVPAPATEKLVRGFPVRLSDVDFELTTPTGAAIVTTLVDPARECPELNHAGAGLGAGDKAIPGIPNMLRLLVGESRRRAQPGRLGPFIEEQVLLLEANLDDMDPETFGHFLELALRDGALDVFFSPIQMKKNRPAVLLSVLCRPEDRDRMAQLIFCETTTLGVRLSMVDRWALPRSEEVVETEFGPVRVKVARLGDRLVNAVPEYEDLKRLADQTGVPLKEIRRKVAGRI
jgi:pyridinium-3,5-bisthiocarboxylic acid mononucleotide nickel chelatase